MKLSFGSSFSEVLVRQEPLPPLGSVCALPARPGGAYATRDLPGQVGASGLVVVPPVPTVSQKTGAHLPGQMLPVAESRRLGENACLTSQASVYTLKLGSFCIFVLTCITLCIIIVHQFGLMSFKSY